jgi:hypothetical protein
MVHDRLDAVKVKFDNERAVSDAGVLLVATLAKRLGLERLSRSPWNLVVAIR